MSGKTQPLIVGLGEILWDVLPSGKHLGGAPANFAFHSKALGAIGVPASAVGDDELGREILSRLDALGLSKRFVVTVPGRPTGTVDVKVDQAGTPEYVIHENVAWDFVPMTDGLRQLASQADAICFGSLAQRNAASRETIHAFLDQAAGECLKVFDINLRQSYYSRQIIERSLRSCSVLKLNDQELPVLAGMFGIEVTGEDSAKALFREFDLRLLALTRGSHGSRLYTREGMFDHPGYPVHVVDTVGAGDAFTAALVMGLLRGDEPGEINDSANRLAARTCSHRGAVPT
jgi:fructokinase